jgi:plasmid stabilization system protein ParE
LAAEGRHVILFRVRNDVLQVVRVLHSAMDFKRHLGAL